MTTISLDKNIVTVINTFTVEPENQQRALELLVEVATQISKPVPGFLSTNFHRSVDGTRIIGYAQYSSMEALQAGAAKILENADNPILAEFRKVASPDPRVYEVYAIVEA